ncbi:hypothetical protein [Xanthocytophaga flava]|uniref:hypothetical protein n=1 Tax=Xanthocytophaga flava TaxID=3048013 RepID=UPI0028D15BB7|nr:hypothetical protein [Xanthocytophaga flavus]MDJ1470218.1 hypothetical protein [Xanthocytophaga flavus]
MKIQHLSTPQICVLQTIFRYLIVVILVASCQKKLEVNPVDQNTAVPEFNFLARVVESSTKDTLYAEIYVKQLDFQAPKENYKLIVTFPQGLDGSVFYGNEEFRSGDWIEISYQQLNEYTTLLKVVPFKPKAGTYTVNMVCSDRLNKYKSTSISITIP